jgi:hypothetical protein
MLIKHVKYYLSKPTLIFLYLKRSTSMFTKSALNLLKVEKVALRLSADFLNRKSVYDCSLLRKDTTESAE